MNVRCPSCHAEESVGVSPAYHNRLDVEPCEECGATPTTPDEIAAVTREFDDRYDGPGDDYYTESCGGGESPSYRRDMIDAGRGHLLP